MYKHIYIYICIYIYIYLHKYMYKYRYICIYVQVSVHYIYRLKAGGSPELRGTLSLDAIPERSFLYTDGGGGGVGGV